MAVAVEKLQKWLDAKEEEHLECKEAKTNFHFETLVKYCVALANEGGGKMILGVTDKLPRTVVGSQAFPHLERTKAGLIERLRLRVAVDLVHREQPVPDLLKSRVEHLLEQGIIERLGRGRGVRLLLSQRFYRRLGKAGVYTRKRGLDRETNKALLIRHLRESGDAGCPVSELQQILPAQSRDQLKRLLGELRHEGRARLVGERRGARWRAEGGG